MARAYATSPLRLLTPRNHGSAAWIYSSSYGGGLVSGDALRLELRVAARAAAFLSTQASTKVYRSPLTATVAMNATVASEGQLVVWPDPVVCFAGSRYEQHQHFELDSGAALIVVDGLTSGRRESGERWQFARYANRLSVRYERRTVLLDAVCLCAENGELTGRMGRFNVLCTITMIGARLAPHVRRVLDAVAAARVERHARMLVGAAPVGHIGVILRVAAESWTDAVTVVSHHLCFVPALLGDNPWTRKW